MQRTLAFSPWQQQGLAAAAVLELLSGSEAGIFLAADTDDPLWLAPDEPETRLSQWPRVLDCFPADQIESVRQYLTGVRGEVQRQLEACAPEFVTFTQTGRTRARVVRRYPERHLLIPGVAQPRNSKYTRRGG